MGWFLLQKLADLLRVYYLHIISRNKDIAALVDQTAENKNLSSTKARKSK